MAFLEAMDFSEADVPAQKIGHGAIIKPVPVKLPLTAGANETVEREHLEDLIPARSLTARWQLVPPKTIEPELLPELAPQSAGAPLARPHQARRG